MAERIAYLLIPAYCSPPTTNRTGEVRLDEMGPCLGTAGLVLMAVLASSSAALAAGDPSAGQTVFASHCAVCHFDTVRRKQNRAVARRHCRQQERHSCRFDFSPAMKDANITWDDDKLDKFLADPPGFIIILRGAFGPGAVVTEGQFR